MDIDKQKAELRPLALERRQRAAQTADAPKRLAELFIRHFEIGAGEVVSGYYPVRGELDPRPLMDWIAGRGATIGLPVVEGRGRPLVFRRWRPGDALETGIFGVPVPGPDAPLVTPTLLLVPLLAFDGQGYRLGYGGGYYDRTIAALGAARTIGLAFEGQKLDAVPRDRHDRRLDWVVTETTVLRCAARDGTPKP